MGTLVENRPLHCPRGWSPVTTDCPYVAEAFTKRPIVSLQVVTKIYAKCKWVWEALQPENLDISYEVMAY